MRFPPYAPYRRAENGLDSDSVINAKPVYGDIEDYFQEHRWSFLTRAMLTSGSDTEANLRRALEWIRWHADREDLAWEPYSASERVANLLVYLSVTKIPALHTQVGKFVADSLSWIHDHLEYYGPDGTNNHILNNARALAMGGVVVGNAGAVSVAMEICRQFLPRLIQDDGFLRERSSHYQLVVLNWLLDMWHFVASRPDMAADGDIDFLTGYVGKMRDAARMLVDERRLIGLVGDVSPDSSPAESLARLSIYPDQWPVGAEERPRVETRDGWFRVSQSKSTVLGNFPRGRYPFAYPTHGHSDLTSFVWRHEGQEVLADGGRYRYTPDEISFFQRSAAAHNVPVIDGFAPFSETILPNRQWWPIPYATAELELIPAEHGVTLSHDGFSRATSVKRHSRFISLHDALLVVTDTFEGTGEVEASFCWHFGRSFRHFDVVELKARGEAFDVSLSVEGVIGEPRVGYTSGTAPGSWSSQIYGEARRAVGVCLSWRLSLPVTVRTEFSVRRCAA